MATKTKKNEPMESPENVIGLCACCSEERHKQWQTDNKNLKVKTGDMVKLKVEDKNGTEYMWFRVLDINRKDMTGQCGNEPVVVKCIKYGGMKKFTFKDINDYQKDDI
jgi:uncharacterized protein YegJ (DUF2314 family)